MVNNMINRLAKSIHPTKQKEMNYTNMALNSFLDKALQESMSQIDLYNYAKQISDNFNKSVLPYLIKLVAQYSDNLSLDATINVNLQNSMSVQEKNDVIAKEKESAVITGRFFRDWDGCFTKKFTILEYLGYVRDDYKNYLLNTKGECKNVTNDDKCHLKLLGSELEKVRNYDSARNKIEYIVNNYVNIELHGSYWSIADFSDILLSEYQKAKIQNFYFESGESINVKGVPNHSNFFVIGVQSFYVNHYYDYLCVNIFKTKKLFDLESIENIGNIYMPAHFSRLLEFASYEKLFFERDKWTIIQDLDEMLKAEVYTYAKRFDIGYNNIFDNYKADPSYYHLNIFNEAIAIKDISIRSFIIKKKGRILPTNWGILGENIGRIYCAWCIILENQPLFEPLFVELNKRISETEPTLLTIYGKDEAKLINAHDLFVTETLIKSDIDSWLYWFGGIPCNNHRKIEWIYKKNITKKWRGEKRALSYFVEKLSRNSKIDFPNARKIFDIQIKQNDKYQSTFSDIDKVFA